MDSMQSWKGKDNEEGTQVLKWRKKWRAYRPEEKPGHLYLVLDDWSWGYSIRKIDLSFGYPGHQLIPTGGGRRYAICTRMRRLPSALLRFQGERGKPRSIHGALGNMILAMPRFDVNSLVRHGGTVIDIHERTFIDGPWQDAWRDMLNPICIPVCERLFFLGGGSFRMLCPLPADANFYNIVWEWCELSKPIFQCELVTSYAVHPDEQTIFVSGSFDVPTTFTYTEDTSSSSEESKWKQHGLWQLPFSGRGYFDPELDAWVGLSAQLDTIGHICSCDVASTNSDTSDRQCPSVKFSKEKLFSEVPTERHMGATLVYMGGESNFCLLEGIHIQPDLANQPTESGEMNEDFVDELNEYSVSELDETDSDVNEFSDSEVKEEQDQKRFLRLTTFSLKYDRNGDLTTGNSRRVWYYSVPLEITCSILECPVAFWM